MEAGKEMICPRTNALHILLARAGPVVRPNLLEAGKGSSMSEVENQQLVTTGKVHTSGQWLRGLWISLFGEVVVVWG